VRSIAPAVALCLFGAAAAAGLPLDIRYNGSPRPLPPDARFAPCPGSVAGETGVTLAEVFGPQVEAWRLEAGAEVLAADDVGERLSAMYLVRAAAGWDLVMDPAPDGSRRRLRGLSRLILYGEPCPERELEVWVGWEGVPALKAEIMAWAASAGVKARVVEVPSIKAKLMAVLRGGGRVPDVVMVQSDYLGDLAAIGALQELDGLRLPAAIGKGAASFELGGRRLAAPFYADAQLVFYSTDLVRVPPPEGWTLDDMERIARASGAEAPAAWNVYSAYWFLPFVAGYGLEPFRDGRADLKHPAWARALDWLKGATDRGFLVPMERDAMMAYFTSGRAAFILSGSYSIPEFKDIGLRFGVAPYPRVTGGAQLAPLLDFKGFAVTRTARSPVLARRLVQHLSNPATQARFCAPLWKLPADAEARALLPAGDPYVAAVRRRYEAGMPVPAYPIYGEFKNAMWKLLRLYLDGSMTRDEILAAAGTILGE